MPHHTHWSLNHLKIPAPVFRNLVRLPIALSSVTQVLPHPFSTVTFFAGKVKLHHHASKFQAFFMNVEHEDLGNERN